MHRGVRSENFLLLILAAAQFCHIVDFMIMMPLGPQLMNKFSLSAIEFSFLVSSYSLSAGASGFLMAFFADRFDRKNLLVLMFAGFTLSTFACGLASSYSFLLWARLLTGAFGGVIGSVVLAIVSDLVPMERRGTAMGILTTAFSTASVVGVPFSIYLGSAFSWKAPFLFLVAVSFLVLLLVMQNLPKMAGHLEKGRVPPLEGFQRILENSNQIRALFFLVFLTFAHFLVIPFLSPSMVANVGFSESQLTWIYFFGGLSSILTGPWIGRLADRHGKHRVFILGGTMALVPTLLITHLGPVGLPAALGVTTLFFIFAGGRMVPAMAIVSGTVLSRNRGSFMSLQSCLQQISMGLASLMAGWIVTRDPSGALLRYPVVGYISVGAGLVCLYLVGKVKVVEQST